MDTSSTRVFLVVKKRVMFMPLMWFPSAFVLQGSGLNPVPQTIRASNAILALESFMAAIEAWDFFDGGLLKFKEIFRLGISSDRPSWTKALNNNEEHFLTAVNNPCKQKSIKGKVHSLGSLLSDLDFRIPKPASGVLFGRETSEHTQIRGSAISSNKDTPHETCSHIKDAGPVRTSAKLKPLFMERKCATIITNSGHLIPSSAKSSYVSDTTCQQSVRRSNTADLQKDKSFQSREPIPKGVAGKETHVSPEALTKDLNTKKNAAIQEDESSKTLKQKGVTKKLHNCLKDTKKVITAEAETEMFSNKQEKSAEDKEQKMPKKRAKHHIDPSDIIAKVTDYHARGQLATLTVPELKGFLGARKAKVGGKKEDLIQRIVSLLDMR